MIAWSHKVSSEFLRKLVDGCCDLELDPDWVMAVIAFETGGRFYSGVRNVSTDATGLIQFMPSTAARLGTTIDQLADMTPEQQLDYVFKYFEPYRGRINSLEDCYMAVLWPKAIGKEPDYVLFREGMLAYKLNAGLDYDKDGKVTKCEACAPVRRRLREGLAMPNGKAWTET